MLNEKDTDTRPLLDRIEAYLSGSPDFTLTREDDQLAVAFAATKLTFRNADATKGVVAKCDGLESAVERRLLVVKGVAVRRVGTEVSWRALEQVCAVIAASATPKARKARAAATERKAATDALKATAAAEAEQRAREAAIPAIEKLADLVRWQHGVQVSSGCVSMGDVSVSQGGNRTLRVSFRYAVDAVATVRDIAGARFDGDRKEWSVPGAEHMELARLLPLMARHVVAAENERQKERAAARVGAEPIMCAQIRPTKPRMLVLSSRRPLVGDLVRYGKAAMVVQDFGKEFRVDENMPSMHGSWLLGHEGERCAYAYLREATLDEAATLEADDAAERAEAAAVRERDAKLRALQDAIRSEGDYLPRQAMPTGTYLVKAPPGETIYGYGTDILRAEDGAIWLIEHRGADGDDWSSNNLPGAIGHRLPPGARADGLVRSVAPR
jgi:hypothetical protein